MKAKSVLLWLSIVSYILGITESLFNLGILSGLYSFVSQTAVFYLLMIVGTAFLITYIIESLRKPKNEIYAAVVRQRPFMVDFLNPHKIEVYGVRWRLFEPDILSTGRQPWADGPFCPKCDRELEEKMKGHILKRPIWLCPFCQGVYPRPNFDVKESVEKDFAAQLRKVGKL